MSNVLVLLTAESKWAIQSFLLNLNPLQDESVKHKKKKEKKSKKKREKKKKAKKEKKTSGAEDGSSDGSVVNHECVIHSRVVLMN